MGQSPKPLRRLCEVHDRSLCKVNTRFMPIYYLSLFKATEKISARIDQLIIDFVWGSSVVKRKIHGLKWDVVALPKEWGGLGFRKIKD